MNFLWHIWHRLPREMEGSSSLLPLECMEVERGVEKPENRGVNCPKFADGVELSEKRDLGVAKPETPNEKPDSETVAVGVAKLEEPNDKRDSEAVAAGVAKPETSDESSEGDLVGVGMKLELELPLPARYVSVVRVAIIDSSSESSSQGSATTQ